MVRKGRVGHYNAKEKLSTKQSPKKKKFKNKRSDQVWAGKVIYQKKNVINKERKKEEKEKEKEEKKKK